MTLANKITITRIALTPFFLICLIYGFFIPAFFFYLTSSITDGLDGFYARRRRQQTKLGSLLDPLADKFFLIPTYVYLTQLGLLPKWLFVILLSRDLTILSGWLVNFAQGREFAVKPQLSGKIAIAAQMVYFLLIMIKMAFPSLWPSDQNHFLAAWTNLTGACAFVSFVDYLIQGSLNYSKHHA